MTLCVPPVLNPQNPQHVHSVVHAIQSTQAVDNGIRMPAEATLAACEESQGYAGILLTIAGSDGCKVPMQVSIDIHVRTLAVILLKNLVRGCWKDRGGPRRVVTLEEKTEVRGFLMSHLEEKNEIVASQLAILMAKVAREDWPKAWPTFLQELTAQAVMASQESNDLKRMRTLYTLHQSLKEICSKRIGFDRQSFQKAAAEVFPSLYTLWKNAALRATDPQLVVVLLKAMHRIVVYGLPGIDKSAIGYWFEALLCNMQTVLQSVISFSADSTAAAPSPSVLLPSQKQLKRSAKVVTAIQRSYPVDFHQYLQPFLLFFYEKLHALAPRNGLESSCDDFLIECCTFLGEGLSCRSYRVDLLRTGAVTSTTAATKPLNSNIMAEFWSNERITRLCELCFERLLSLTTKDVQSWEDDPEAFFLTQDSLLPSENLRVGGEQLYLSLMEAPGRGTLLAPHIAQLVMESGSQQIEAASSVAQITPQVLFWDSVYLAVGLSAYTLSKCLEFREWFLRTLGPLLRQMLVHGTTSPPILLCRTFWLLGCWIDKVPCEVLGDIIEAIVAVKSGTEDIATRLAAFTCLDGLLESCNLDPSATLQPVLGRLLQESYMLLGDLSYLESRQQAFNTIKAVVQRAGEALRPHVADVVNPLFRLLDSWSDQPPLFSSCLGIAARAVRAAAGNDAASSSIFPTVLHMVSVSTDPQGQHHAFLIGPGLELWYCLMQCDPPCQQPELLQGLYSRMTAILEGNMEHSRTCMLITEAYVVLGGGEFLSTHGANVASCMELMVGEVKEQVMCYVARAMEAILRKFPTQGSMLLYSSISKATCACRNRVQRATMAGHGHSGAQGGGNKEELEFEPDIVIMLYASIVCRVILGCDIDTWNILHRSTGISVSEVVHLLTELFDITEDYLHRKLWTWTMMWALRIDPKSALSQLGEIFGCCVQVLGEGEMISNQKGIMASSPLGGVLPFGDVSDDEGEGQGLPDPPLTLRIREDINADHIATTNLKSVIREAMDACSDSVGPDVFQYALSTIEPMTVQQLSDMVRSA